VFGDLNNFDNFEQIFGEAVELGYMPKDIKEMQQEKVAAHFAALDPVVNKETVLIDGGLVSMQLMLVARAHGYDTNAIG
ncbi:nitroreductase family protein, partial [Bacillus cereus]|nr:nitroreductase family protein [Bacillus cereus]